MVGIDIDAQERSGDVEIGGVDCSASFGGRGPCSRYSVAEGQVEFFSRERLRCAGQRDQRSTFLDKIPERAQPLFADAAAVFGREVFKVAFAAGAAFEDNLAGGIGQDDHLVSCV